MDWKPLMIDCYQQLEDRFNSMNRALEFFDQAMLQPDQYGTQRDAIDWLRESAAELRDAYWSYKLSELARSFP